MLGLDGIILPSVCKIPLPLLLLVPNNKLPYIRENTIDEFPIVVEFVPFPIVFEPMTISFILVGAKPYELLPINILFDVDTNDTVPKEYLPELLPIATLLLPIVKLPKDAYPILTLLVDAVIDCNEYAPKATFPPPIVLLLNTKYPKTVFVFIFEGPNPNDIPLKLLLFVVPI